VDTNAAAFKRLYDIIVRLRAPGGCPWDQEQTPESLRGNLIEETYECVEAIDEKSPEHIKEELGDLVLVAAMISYMYEEAGVFSVAETLNGISEKLTRRHPHVFGNQQVKDSAEVLDNWVKIKVDQEGRRPNASILDQTPGSLPPLDRAYRLQKKAALAGFDWLSAAAVIRKVEEELSETAEAAEICKTLEAATDTEQARYAAPREALEGELGDLLFAAVNLCRFLNVDPSVALNRTNGKFIRRFMYVEKKMRETNQEMKQENLDSMERFWEEAKQGGRDL
jgi:tetrapyrrole methylase family protein/MazG family protein